MTFAAPEPTTGESNDALDMAKARLAEHGDMAERAVRFHLAEAICSELNGIREELSALREDLKQNPR